MKTEAKLGNWFKLRNANRCSTNAVITFLINEHYYYNSARSLMYSMYVVDT